MKKLVAALFLSSGLVVAAAPAALAQPPAAACHGLSTAHASVPAGNPAHGAIPHPHCH